ncbi:MAG: urease accessory protein UreE [Pseudomonadota bacterium]
MEVLPFGHGRSPSDYVSLDFEARFLRRKRLSLRSGQSVLVDLPHAVGLLAGQALLCDTGLVVEVEAAAEPLLSIQGEDLVRLAWHIGNRHTPCQIAADRLLIQQNPVLAHMLETLGARVEPISAVFEPETGAYGTGRTMGHDHGHDHSRSHPHDHGAPHEHE